MLALHSDASQMAWEVLVSRQFVIYGFFHLVSYVESMQTIFLKTPNAY